MRGDSMWPTLRTGDVVRLEPAAQVRRGDIVAFQRGADAILHRVVAHAGAGVVCRGDNRPADDGPVPSALIIGRAVAVRRGGCGTPRRLTGGTPGALHAMILLGRRRARFMWWRLLREGQLLAQQARGAVPPWRPEDLGDRWHGLRRGGSVPGGQASEGAPHVLAPDELSVSGSSATPDVVSRWARLVIPADIFCFLPGEARRALVARLLAHVPAPERTVVAAFARGPRTRVPRVTAQLRRALAAVGVPAGEPGDAVVAGRSWPEPTYARFFAADELVDELRAAGAEVVRLTPVLARGVELWHASVRSSSGTT